MSKIRIGIIGAGQIATIFAEGIKEAPHAQLRAVCDVRVDASLTSAMDWGADRYYTDYQALLRDDKVDAVLILTPNHLHGTMALDAVRAGKHVAVARPLALNLAVARQIADEAQQARLHLCVLEPALFYTPLLDAKSYLDAGEIGTPIGILSKVGVGAPEGGWSIAPESWLWRFDPEQSGGGPFLFDAIYETLVASTYLMGGVHQLQAWIGRTEIYPGYYVDAPGTVMWKHHNGCTGGMQLTYSPEMYIASPYYPSDSWVEVTGTRGLMRIRMAPGKVGLRPALEMFRDGRTFTFGEVDDQWDSSLKRTVADFAQAIAEGTLPRCTPDVAHMHLRTTLAARESSLTEQLQVLS